MLTLTFLLGKFKKGGTLSRKLVSYFNADELKLSGSKSLIIKEAITLPFKSFFLVSTLI